MRMTRLYEEVVTRLEEMAMIAARALKLDAGAGSTIRFNPLAEDSEVEFGAVGILSTPHGEGCYDYREGVCFGTIARRIESKPQIDFQV